MLWLLRHAKSSWADPSLADHDRPLAPRGISAAKRIAKHVKSEGIRPALVLCSPARRARDTLDAVRPALGKAVEVRIEAELYAAPARAMLARLRTVDAVVTSVLVVGHNPGLHDLATELTGDGDERALARLRTKFPTGALATLDIDDTEWAQLGRGQAYLVSLVVPPDLP